MFRCITNIVISQQPRPDFPNRKKVLGFDFVHTFETSDNWRDLSNKGKVIIPKALYYKDGNGKAQPLQGNTINVGGFSSNDPLFMRGDKITIDAGYKYFNARGQEVLETNNLLTGYITKVNSKIPIELEVDGYMFLCKQTPVPAKTFLKTDTLEVIIKYLIGLVNAAFGTTLTARPLTTTTFGENFAIGGESVAQVLERLQKRFGFESYFFNDELRSGVLVYNPADNVDKNGQPIYKVFYFQQNIISDQLEYQRKEDIILSAVCKNTIEEATGQTTKDGQAKTHKKRLEVLITFIRGKIVSRVIPQGETVPQNTDGERHTFHFLGAKTTDDLIALGTAKLQQYFYTGFRGKFTSFLIPYVRQGDNVIIKDPVLPERNGAYKVKGVEYSGGVGGGRQVIELDFKLNINV